MSQDHADDQVRGNSTHIRLENITLRYGSTTALDSVSIMIEQGTIHALLGENGAGKSTLGNVLCGLRRPSSGTMQVLGHAANYSSPRDALADGIALVAQEIALVPRLSVRQNALLGVRGRRRRHEAETRLVQMNAELCDLDLDARVQTLRTGEQQQVEILRALVRDARLIMMDEPTAALGQAEAERLLTLLKKLRSTGMTIVFVSHHLEEVLDLADNATIMRNGRVVRNGSIAGMTVDQLLGEMVGQPVSTAFPQRSEPRYEDEPRVVVRSLARTGLFEGISFAIAPGEILGIGGLLGSGRSEIARCIAGVDRFDEGTISLDGRPYRPKSPGEAIRAGVAFVPESRKEEGLLLNRSMAENISLPHLSMIARLGFINLRREWRSARDRSFSLEVRPLSRNLPVASLSGGNQQKILFARWLESTPRLVIVDEPTRGVDMAARLEIYRAITVAAEAGSAVLLISSEIEELVGLADRVLVLWRGRISSELDRRTLNSESLAELVQTGSPAEHPSSVMEGVHA